MNKILMIGLGGIGQRHLQNTRELNPSVEIYAYRQRNNNTIIQNLSILGSTKSIKEFYNIKKEYYDLDEALNGDHYDLVFICNPSSFHLETALKVAKKGFNIFMEKPISHNLKDIEKLQKIVKEKKILVFVGYQMRFHPCIQYVKDLIKNTPNTDFLYSIVSVYISHGAYMPSFHKWEDYEDLYCSKKELGGGVILSQIHELDYLLWIFGEVALKYAIGGHLSNLKIDVEDNVDVLFKKNNHAIGLHLDFIQDPPERYIKITTKKDVYDINLLTHNIWKNKKHALNCVLLNWNDLFLEQLETVFQSIKQNKILPPLATLDDGIKSLKLAMQIKEMIKDG